MKKFAPVSSTTTKNFRSITFTIQELFYEQATVLYFEMDISVHQRHLSLLLHERHPRSKIVTFLSFQHSPRYSHLLSSSSSELYNVLPANSSFHCRVRAVEAVWQRFDLSN